MSLPQKGKFWAIEGERNDKINFAGNGDDDGFLQLCRYKEYLWRR